MSVKTQGTDLYFIYEGGSEPTIEKVECIVDLNNDADTVSQIDDTCLDGTAQEFVNGLTQVGTTSLTIRPDPASESHLQLYEQFKKKLKTKFVVGWADGPLDASGKPTVQPSLDSSDDFNLPNTRTWTRFDGNISGWPENWAQNSTVSAAITIQRSGDKEWLPRVVQ